MTDITRQVLEKHIAWLVEQREKAKKEKDKEKELIFAEKKDTACYLLEEIDYQESKFFIEQLKNGKRE